MLEVQIIQPHPRAADSETEGGEVMPSNLCFNSLPGDSHDAKIWKEPLEKVHLISSRPQFLSLWV